MYRYKSKLVKVIDGDTIDAMVDLGFDMWVKKRIRLAHIDAYEWRTRNKEEKKKGIQARDSLIEILRLTDDEFYLKSLGVDKYGRCLGEISMIKRYIRTPKYHGKSINEFLVREGHATRYEG